MKALYYVKTRVQHQTYDEWNQTKEVHINEMKIFICMSLHLSWNLLFISALKSHNYNDNQLLWSIPLLVKIYDELK